MMKRYLFFIVIPFLVFAKGTINHVIKSSQEIELTPASKVIINGNANVTANGELRLEDTTGGEYVGLKSPSRSEEHTSELQSHSFISYAVFCLKKKKKTHKQNKQ